jgi:chromate transporter
MTRHAASDHDRAPAESAPTGDPGCWLRRLADTCGAFLKLGCMSFGGPIAHLGYFRTEFVEKRHWLDDDAYADLAALYKPVIAQGVRGGCDVAAAMIAFCALQVWKTPPWAVVLLMAGVGRWLLGS